MKITIIGATGATGVQLMEQALSTGDQVVACARNPSRIGASHAHRTIVRGELTGAAAIERAVGGADPSCLRQAPAIGN